METSSPSRKRTPQSTTSAPQRRASQWRLAFVGDEDEAIAPSRTVMLQRLHAHARISCASFVKRNICILLLKWGAMGAASEDKLVSNWRDLLDRYARVSFAVERELQEEHGL